MKWGLKIIWSVMFVDREVFGCSSGYHVAVSVGDPTVQMCFGRSRFTRPLSSFLALKSGAAKIRSGSATGYPTGAWKLLVWIGRFQFPNSFWAFLGRYLQIFVPVTDPFFDPPFFWHGFMFIISRVLFLVSGIMVQPHLGKLYSQSISSWVFNQ